jgi:hypothetical protein
MAFMDATQPNRRWSYYGCRFNNGFDVTGGITAVLGGAFDACGDGITDLQGRPNDYEFSIGTITDFDIAQGVIGHALRYSVSMDAALPPPAWDQGIAWPSVHSEWNGPTQYSGKIQFGATIGIPASVNLAALGLTQGGLMLARALQLYGAMMRDTGGSNAIIFYATPELETNPLITEMRNDMAKIVPRLSVMRNQGPTTVFGGGTSIAPAPLACDPSVCPAPPL